MDQKDVEETIGRRVRGKGRIPRQQYVHQSGTLLIRLLEDNLQDNPGSTWFVFIENRQHTTEKKTANYGK